MEGKLVVLQNNTVDKDYEVRNAQRLAIAERMHQEDVVSRAQAGFTHTLSCTLAYNGADFAGFAKQNDVHVVTVQGQLEHALSLLYKRDIATTCAGRTDAGVHARSQVVSFDITDEEFQSRTLTVLTRSLNALMDDAIAVEKVEERPFGFSARFNAEWREYHYHICTQSARPVLIMPIVWHLPGLDLDVGAMNEAAQYLIGEHDFKSFCMAASAVGKPTHRNVFELEIYPETIAGTQVLTVRIVGNAFLHSMVRTIVGTLVEVGRKKHEPIWVREVLYACDRRAAGQNAPASGLVFWDISYKEESACN